MSRKLEIWTDKGNQPRYLDATVTLQDGICTLVDSISDIVPTIKPSIFEYTSEYAMIQQIVKDFSDGYMVVDKGKI